MSRASMNGAAMTKLSHVAVAAAVVALSLSALGIRGAAPVAHAQPGAAVPTEVLVVLAKEEAGEIDPALAAVAGLRRPPFNAFRSMRILDRPRVSLRVNTPATINLPNGRRLQLVIQQVMPDGRYRIRASINRPEQNDYLPLLQVIASPGDPFVVAGQRHEGGTLVIVVRAGNAPAARAAPAAATH